MLKHATHGRRVAFRDEIQFQTPFGYMFRSLAEDPNKLLLPTDSTMAGLLQLGAAMVDPGTPATLDSAIPAGFTYFGQFVDHDVTANTDREIGFSDIFDFDGTAKRLVPVAPADVAAGLVNGRRPQLDLDSVYGDGPGLIPGVRTQAQPIYRNANLRLLVFSGGDVFDLPRRERQARIADMRNDENVIVSQLHTAFLRFHNKVADNLSGSDQDRYIRGRQLTRWAYQYIVVNDYLPAVCDPNVIADIQANGPRFFAPPISGGEMFMPLEFSVAAFRFGHSMIRPAYRLNGPTNDPANIQNIQDLIEVRRILEEGGLDQLPPSLRVEFRNFVGPDAQMARQIDTKLSMGLFELPFGPDLERVLAQRNLLRGFLLSLPTGQAVAHGMGIRALRANELLQDEPDGVHDAFETGDFGSRTPLWYYVLREAALQTQGNSLGAVGSRLVGETLIGFAKQDRNSYLNSADPAIQANGIDVGGTVVGTLEQFLDFAEAL